MVKNQKTTPWKRVTDAAWKRILLVVGAVVVIILVAFIVVQHSYQQRIDKLSTAVDTVWQDPIKSISGVSKTSSTTAPYFTDSLGWNDACPCPRVNHSWLVLVAPDQEADFIRNAFQQSGYQATVNNYQTPGAAGTGTKDHVTLNVGFYSIDSREQTPYQAPSGKVWKSFSADASEVTN